MDKQSYFHMCQKCHSIVEKVYQKGYCKSCLAEYFQKIQPILNYAHPRYDNSGDKIHKKQKIL